ncbi:MAG: hypothetical protein QGG94_03400 [Prochlorococcaceae cyanobacterium ETNP1_MAG_9]|nr:hypothetical protein [Prochlorococcaceae cyanobacterium ETNP1_MAG_9]
MLKGVVITEILRRVCINFEQTLDLRRFLLFLSWSICSAVVVAVAFGPSLSGSLEGAHQEDLTRLKGYGK